MGFAYTRIGAPVMCFNPAKNWQLGWYSEKSSTVSVDNGAWRGRLYGYSDFETSPGDVLLQIGDIQLQYNKIANLNRDQEIARNQIAITRSTLEQNGRSNALGALDTSTSELTINNFANGAALIIKVCGMIQEPNGLSYYDLSVRSSGQADVCGQAAPEFNAAPTPNPTNQPTPGPTNQPTPPLPLSPMPTPEPTPVPTNRPTPSPTIRATFNPLACDDDKETKFLVSKPSEGLWGFGLESCVWLQARSDMQALYCNPSHIAYTVCEETCGSCTDECTDTDGYFKHKNIDRPCDWLRLRFGVQKEICVPGHQAMDVCPETCDVCDVPAERK